MKVMATTQLWRGNFFATSKHLKLSAATLVFMLGQLVLGLFATPQTALAAGTVTNCTWIGAGGLQTALSGGGAVTFTCSGTIVMPEFTVAANTSLDGSGLAVTLSGASSNRLFTVNGGVTLTITNLNLANGNSSGGAGGAINNAGTLNLNTATVFSNASGGGNGGAISSTGTLNVSNAIFSGNTGGNNANGGAINASGTLNISNSTFSNNSVTGNGNGGAINSSATLTISGSTFSNNSTTNGDGGAILSNSANATINATTFSNNTNSNNGLGGAVRNSNNLTLNNSIFNNNTSGGGGGGIYNNTAGNLTIRNGSFSGNVTTGASGAAIRNNNGNLNINNSLFDNNNANGANGGALAILGGAITIDDTTISNNSATGGGVGGGIVVFGGSLTLTNSTINNNSTTGFGAQGGGIYIDSSPVNITNVTITANTAGNNGGGGIYVNGNQNVTLNNTSIIANTNGGGIRGGGGNTILRNTLLVNNTTNGANCSNTFSATGTSNIVFPASTCPNSATASANPAGALGNNGGATQTIPIVVVATNSPVNGGNAGTCAATDQRYAARVGVCDVGAYEFNGTAPTLTLAPGTLPNGTQAVAYSQNVNVSGGTAPYTFSISAGSLPTGLTLSAAGATATISGTPTTPGTYSFTLFVYDNNGNIASQAYTVTIAAVVITLAPTTLPGGTIGTFYNQVIAPSGGTTANYTYSVISGSLPPGLSLTTGPAPFANLSGTPVGAGGTYNFTVQATDGNGFSGTRSYSLLITPVIAFNPPPPPNGTIGVPYSKTFTVTGGQTPHIFSITAGTLPAGLTLSSGGVLSGTPSAIGTFNFTVTATDANGFTGSQAYAVRIANPVVLAPTTLPNGTVSTPYTGATTITASGGSVANFTFAVTSGVLPPGLSLTGATATTVTVSGTPTAAGVFSFTVTATDTNGFTGSQNYTVVINNAGAIDITPPGAANGTAGTAYTSTALAGTGGTAPYTFAVTSGTLPPGVTLSAAGVWGGTPPANSVGGTYTFVVTATDANTLTGNRAYSITIKPIITLASPLANGTVGAAYTGSTAVASGGQTPFSYAVSSGSLPTGLTLNTATGAVSGTPTVAGIFNFTVTATDQNNFTGSQLYTVTIAPAFTVTSAPPLANGQAFVAYVGVTFGISAGTASNFAVTSGAIPPGMTLNATSGLLNGTPTVAGSYPFTITATDTNGYTASQNYTLVVNPAPGITVNPATVPNGTIGTAYAGATFTATGGTAAYTFAVTQGTLPPGLTLAAGGALSGTPTGTGGTFGFTITATDANTLTGSRFYSITITPVLAISPTPPPGKVGTPYNHAFTATGGAAPYTFTVTAGTLPGGLSLSLGGVLSGTPNTANISGFAFTVTVTDANGFSANQAYTVSIRPTPDITPTALSTGSVGVAYTSAALNGTGGTAPYTFAVTSGALPPGITLSGAGVWGGTPTVAGNFTFTVTVTDTNGDTGTRRYTLVVNPINGLTLNPPGLPNGQTGAAYNQTITASGGTGPYTFAVTGGVLPNGLTLSAGGVLSGTPTTGGTFTFVVTATDTITPFATGNRQYTVVIRPIISLTPTTLPNGVAGTAYTTTTITAAPNTGTYSFIISAGALPPGLALTGATATTIAVSGTPTTVGSYNFTVTATDSNGFSGLQAYTVVITSPVTAVNPATLPNGTVGIAYAGATFSATGGTAPYTFVVTSGALPPGLVLAGANLSGTPSASGSFFFTITATDTNGYTASRAYTVLINPAPVIVLSPATLPGGAIGAAYNQTITAAGGTPAYTFAVTGGAVPNGLALSAGGVLSGTPTNPSGIYNFVVTATDSLGSTGSRSYTIVISDSPQLTLSPATLPSGTIGVAYTTTTITASGGTPAYTFALTGGALPNGLTLTGAGVLSGTPTAPSGIFNFTITATDSTSLTGSRAYSIAISNAGQLTLNPQTLPNGVAGTAYNQTITATGGSGTYTFAVSGGTVPTGLTLSGAGALSGTPTVGGTYTITVTATDSANAAVTGSQQYTITIRPTITIAPAVLPAGTVGTAYNQTISASGGTAPYTLAVTSGALPSGITFAGGVLAGTPTVAGVFSLIISATDVNGFSTSQPYNLVINSAVTVNPATVPTGTAGVAYNQTFTAVGGAAPYSFAITSGSLPGLVLSPAGVLSGTPTSAGTFSFVVTATDSGSLTGSRAYSLTVNAGATIALSPATLPTGQVGVAYTSTTITASGGTAPYSFAVTGGALPNGLTLTAAGVLSGTPTTPSGVFNFTITATDSTSTSGNRTFTIVIDSTLPPPVYNSTPTLGSTISVATTLGVDVEATITVSNLGSSALNVSTPVLSGANAAAFSISPNEAFGIPAGPTRQFITVKCKAAALTTFTATLTYTTNDPTRATVTYNLSCLVNPNPGTSFFKTIAPKRLYDTRPAGANTPNPPLGVGTGRYAPGEIRTIQVVGQFGIPTTAVAVLANVTVTDVAAGGFLTVFPANLADSNTSAVNWYAGGSRTINNFALIGLSPTGEFKVKAGNTAHVIIDVTGYLDTNYGGGSVFKPVTATNQRLYDSRIAGTNPLNPPLGLGDGVVTKGNIRTIQVGGQLGVPANATAVAVSLTAANTQRGGYFTLYPSGSTVPNVSSLNWNDTTTPNTNIPKDVSNFVVVPLSNGKLDLTAGGNDPTSGADVIIDVVGYFEQEAAPPSGFQVLFSSQLRLYDSRPDQISYPGNPTKGTLAPGATRTIKAAGLLGVPADAKAVMVRITVVNATGGGYLAVYPGPAYPGNSSVNLNGANQVIGNLAITALNANGEFLIKNGHPNSSLGFIIDIVGYIR